ncbi:substrate-binding periplasmic protein [Aeromonas rivipollensis]|uniref:substrate-binding periplasmic protein n=1 Tax=Aeromonas rivipollensis TaxID=948519 RepID=UPI0038D227C1
MKRKFTPTARRMLGLVLPLLFALPLGARETLSVAWSHWPPFSEIETDGELGGLDVTLTRQILRGANLEPEFRNLPWARALHLMARQQLDVAMGALKTPERERFARFSAPYRRASFVLLSHKAAPGNPDRWQGIRGLADLCQQTGLRLGKLRGTRPLPLSDACPSLRQASEYNSDDRLIALLLARRLDGVIIEWQYARHRLAQLGAEEFTLCQVLLHQQPVSLMFASQAVSDAELARIDAVIADLPALDAAFAPPVCRLDGSQPREEGTQG